MAVKKNTYGAFATDPELEKSGVWLNLGGVGKFLIAYAGGANERFEVLAEEYTRPYRRMITTGTMDEATAKTVMQKVFVDACLLNWEEVTNREGELLSFSKENAYKLMADLPHLFKMLQDEAGSFANFRKETLKDEVKN
jgi:hypothetical protein